MTRLRLLFTIVICFVLARPVGATFESREHTVAVQNKAHYLINEFTLQTAFYPLDAFSKGVSFGGAYTYHFTDEISVEFANLQYLFGVDTGLKQNLLDQFNVKPQELPELKMTLTSNINYNLLYGKNALFNRYVLYSDLLVTAGGGLAMYDPGGMSDLRPLIGVGLGLRFYLQQSLAVRFDVRNYIAVKADGIDNNPYIALGVSSDMLWVKRARTVDLTEQQQK